MVTGGRILENYLKKQYYLNDNGIMDEIVDSLGDCLVQCAYLVLKSKYNLKEDYYKAFLNETTIKLSVLDKNEILSFETIENIFDKEFFSIICHDRLVHNTVEKVSDILRSGEIPAIATIIERFPFSAFYDASYKSKQRRTGHVFIIVGEDKHNFFYVDNPSVISYKQYVTYGNDKGIGVLSKELFLEATQDYCDLLTFKFNMDIMASYIENPKGALIMSRDNYYKEDVYEGNIVNYFGRYALIKLIDLFETERLHFDDLAPSKDRDMITYFNWKIWNIKGRRNLQRHYLKLNRDTNYNVIRLITALEESTKHWDLLYKVLYKDYLKGASVFGKKYVSMIEGIILVEDELNQALNEYLDSQN